ncbi:Nitric oxide-associated protein 1 [Thelohanellus kitauei]|uniref:Nitric oxide-associated protein 1 n=1 Tax=Thelohanellus kitauei TaxID=669202 RepID=A0A0C2MDL1_THEKT|nr:Nitric oxide-associated protein 1 [Thelohanellus kitauei]
MIFRNVLATVYLRHLSRSTKDIVPRNEDRLVMYDPEPKPLPNPKKLLHSLRTVRKRSLEEIRNIHKFIEAGEVSSDLFEKLPLRCHGCGSFFHNDPSLNHGYLRDELFERLNRGVTSVNQLRCKSCFDQINHSKPLPMFMGRNLYRSTMSFVTRRPCLVIYVIDVTDMYGSIADDLVDLLGFNKRVILVFNKIDLLPQDGCHLHAMKHVTMCSKLLIERHPSFIGLKILDYVLTSFEKRVGLSELIHSIIKHYLTDQNLVIMGGCNAGKSTLFNIFQNLMSHQQFEGLPSASTVSQFPGTTSNLIRFPITSKFISSLGKWFTQESSEIQSPETFTIDPVIFEDLKLDKFTANRMEEAQKERIFNINKISRYHLSNALYIPTCSINKQRWLYDTPSTVTKNQIWNRLNTAEMKVLLFSCPIHPRTFKIPQHYSICIADLCRIDVVSVTEVTCPISNEQKTTRVILSVFTEHQVPTFTCPTSGMETRLEMLSRHKKLRVPEKPDSKLTDYKPVELDLSGVNIKRCASDICIPSIGWIGVACAPHVRVKLKIWTRGQEISIRTPALIQQLIMCKGT